MAKCATKKPAAKKAAAGKAMSKKERFMEMIKKGKKK